MKEDRIGKLRSNDTKTINDTLETVRTIDMERLFSAGFGKCEEKTGHTGAVISVKMSEQQCVDAAKAPAKTHNTDLRAFAAIQKDRLPIDTYIQTGQSTVRHWNGTAGSQKAEVEHCHHPFKT
jgi:hypothetical protein